MSVPTAPAAASPLSSLDHDEREQMIAAITERLPRMDAVALLTALGGTRAEVEALPMPLQRQAQKVILAALPAGLGAIVVSKLLIPTVSAQQALQEVLTDQEKADPAFLRRVEEEARSRGISLWEAAIKVRWNSMGIDELAALIQRQQDEWLARTDAADHPDR